MSELVCLELSVLLWIVHVLCQALTARAEFGDIPISTLRTRSVLIWSRPAIHDSRNAVIRGNRQELRLEVITLADVDRDDPVGESLYLRRADDHHGGTKPIWRSY